ncbi:hypothetical protein AGMMS50262_14960 [Bacteroidia bacterium]|nr:hypothetical protein AGMMS50262_14960 [Bacteroidia bacterium]
MSCWLDIVIVICVAFGLIKGLRDGFVKQLMSFIALVAAIFFAGKIAVPFRSFVLHFLTGNDVSIQIVSGLCYLLSFILIILLITLLGKLVCLAIKLTPARPLDILLGSFFGMSIWILSLSILFNLFSAFDVNGTIISKNTQAKSIFYERVKKVVPTIYPIMRNYFKK